jgi:hypothetical protein
MKMSKTGVGSPTDGNFAGRGSFLKGPLTHPRDEGVRAYSNYVDVRQSHRDG